MNSGDISEALYLKSTRVTLRNKRGLHARASAKFATMAQKFNAKITLFMKTTCYTLFFLG